MRLACNRCVPAPWEEKRERNEGKDEWVRERKKDKRERERERKKEERKRERERRRETEMPALQQYKKRGYREWKKRI